MHIRAGYTIDYTCAVATPLVTMLSVHPSRRGDLLTLDTMATSPILPLRGYRDTYGNRCHRLTLPVGTTRISTDFIVRDSGIPDVVPHDAEEIAPDRLPDEALLYLLPSRYCDVEPLLDIAWAAFAGAPSGWRRVQAILDYAHDRITFGYAHARNTRTASEAHAERIGVCRDYAHLAVTLCRAMNIPARYATGYLGDIGVPLSPDPMDFSAWFQVFLSGEWHTVDARHNRPRIGRILLATGRDAADVAISTAFGDARLDRFDVFTDVAPENAAQNAPAAGAAAAIGAAVAAA
jgi:transglutaminase-like putative cysteine protease